MFFLIFFMMIKSLIFSQSFNSKFEITIIDTLTMSSLMNEVAQCFISCVDKPCIYSIPTVNLWFTDTEVKDTFTVLITVDVKSNIDSLYEFNMDIIDFYYPNFNYKQKYSENELLRYETKIKEYFFASLKERKFYSLEIQKFHCTMYYPIRISPQEILPKNE